MTRQFEEASRDWQSGRPFGFTFDGERIPLDLIEYDDEFVVRVDLPGFTREDTEITVSDSTLRIKARREAEIESGEEGNFLRHERHHESVQRSIQLSAEVDTDSVSAPMENGVLEITLPLVEVSESRRIEIE
jgi:HSP20 family protein